MAEYLTPADLQIVTGYLRPGKQAQWLKDKGIPHRVDRSRVIVAQRHVLDWLEGKPHPVGGGINWAAVK